VRIEGILVTLDNRRLQAFRRAATPMAYRMASQDELEAEAWKIEYRFNSPDDGIAIVLRGELRI